MFIAEFFKDPDISGGTFRLLNIINVNKVDGLCQDAAIAAAKVLLDEKYKPSAIISIPENKEKGVDPLQEIKTTLSNDQLFNVSTAKEFFNKLQELKNGELFIVSIENDRGDHAYVITKRKKSLWLIDADRQIYFPLRDPPDFKDFIHQIKGWGEKDQSYCNFLTLSFSKQESKSVKRYNELMQKYKDDKNKVLENIHCDLDLYKFNEKNLELLQLPSEKSKLEEIEFKPPSSLHLLFSKKKEGIIYSLQPWRTRLIFKDSLEANGITVSELKEEEYKELSSLIKKNKNDDGFEQMPFGILNGSEFKKILQGKSTNHCLVAREIKENKMIGFVVAGKNNMGIIDALGVDRDYRHGVAPANIKKIGSSLLLAACNDLFFEQVDTIAAIASNDDAIKFYQKNGFEMIKNSDGDELAISKDKYINIENIFILDSLKNPKPKIDI